MKLLITGANGQLGRCLIDRALADESFEFEAYGSAELDITNYSQLQQVLCTYQPDVVINAAAYTAVDKAESEEERASQVNFEGPKNLAHMCADLDIQLIHVSTDYVFQGNASIPYRETDTTSPLGVYGQTKLDGEQAIQSSGCRHLILRTAWVYSEYGNNFLKTMLRLAETRDRLNVVADQRGCPTYAGDLAQAILDICHFPDMSSESGVYHYVGSTECSWADFARQIFAQANGIQQIGLFAVVEDISTAEYPTPAARPAYSVLDTAKIQKRFGVKPRLLEQVLPEVFVALASQAES